MEHSSPDSGPQAKRTEFAVVTGKQLALSPKLIGPAIALITGLITSTSMSFVALALNYGFQPDFAVRWLKAAATSYVVIVPILMIVIPPIRRFVMRQAGLPTS